MHPFGNPRGLTDTVRPHKTFGRYELLLEMARGGMATLFLARLKGPEHFEKLVVLKRIHEHLAQNEQFVRMFLDESHITAKIHHPNVAMVFDMGRYEGAYFIVMEYIHGSNLAELLQSAVHQSGTFRWPHAVRIISDAAAGLHSAHMTKGTDGRSMQIVHRDVSPQNILVDYQGHVKVVDFGIARAAYRLTHTATGTLKGKVAYMSPEQVLGEEVSPRTDIYALGVVLFEAVCLRRLFKAEHEGAALLKVHEGSLPRPRSVVPEIPQELEEVILKALSRRPEDRFATASEMQEALESVLHIKSERIGTQQIASLMDLYFQESKRAKEEQIALAIDEIERESPYRTGPMGAVCTAIQPDPGLGTNVTVADGGILRKPPIRKPSKVYLVAAGVVLLFVVAAIGVWTYFKQRSGEGGPPSISKTTESMRVASTGVPPTRPEDRANNKPPPMMEPVAPRSINLRILVRPRSARSVVSFLGKRYQGPELQLSLPSRPEPQDLVVQAPGYRVEKMTLRLDRDSNTIVTLLPARQKHKTRRKQRRPAMLGDQALDLPGDMKP